EAVGPGGIVVARDAPHTEWAEALGRLWDDSAEHGRLSAAALDHSRRPDMDPEVVAAMVEDALAEAIERACARSQRVGGRSSTALPLVSVVLPVRNGAATIDAQLAALAAQTYDGPWELVVCDNGSTDATRNRVVSWRGGLPAPVRIVDASGRRGVAHARNVGVRAAAGDLILVCDADDVVSPDWMRHMVQALGDHEIVTGASELRRLNTPDQYDWTGNADQDDAAVAYGFMRHVSGGNLGVRRDVALRLAGFDETLRRAEDIDWSWRAQYGGAEIAYEPASVIHIRLRSELGAVAASRFRGGFTEPQLYRRHREHGMRAESREEVIAIWRWLARKSTTAWRDPTQRIRWTDHAAHRAGRLVGSLRHRTMYL
ncbi:MAG: glycosyltransferase, partial [Acidimicrobiia bacterium]|nr:glycosyltransferase [Acidimicrobiia bacterium]